MSATRKGASRKDLQKLCDWFAEELLKTQCERNEIKRECLNAKANRDAYQSRLYRLTRLGILESPEARTVRLCMDVSEYALMAYRCGPQALLDETRTQMVAELVRRQDDKDKARHRCGFAGEPGDTSQPEETP